MHHALVLKINLAKIGSLIGLFLVMSVSSIFAQSNDASSYSRGIYYKHGHYGLMLHTHGWGIHGRYVKNITFDKRRLLDFDLSATLKHPREQRVFQTQAASRAFIYGKLNHLSILRGFYGRQRIVADFRQPLSIRVNFNYLAGASVAMLKPMFIRVREDDQVRIKKFDPVIHQDPLYILGAAPFASGLGQTSFVPGISLKTSLSFEWGKQEDRYKCVDVGVLIDLYPRVLDIMAYSENQAVFVNGFISFSPWGKRW